MENKSRSLNIRLFGSLYFLMKERSLPTVLQLDVPEEGLTGHAVAEQLGLPVQKIEAVFRNGQIQDLDKKVFPGDRVAMVPFGTPGPYRVLLGIYKSKERLS
jgi:hypothetical protein